MRKDHAANTELGRLGENISREWSSDPHPHKLLNALQLIKSDVPAGVEMLSKLAENGSSLAMMYLGDAYMKGKYGMRKDDDLGEYWLRRSAAGGSIEGAYILAWHLLRSGRTDEALAEYRRLSDLGYSPAQFVLGWQYYKGPAVQRDLPNAMYYLELADKSGHLHAGHWICHILMREHMGPLAWLRGLFKKMRLTIPFVRTMVSYPNSDRLRT